MTFNTIEDINGTQFDNQGFWWHKIDCSKFPKGNFSNIKYDFCTVSRTTHQLHSAASEIYTITVNNDYWTGGGAGIYVGDRNHNRSPFGNIVGNTFEVEELSYVPHSNYYIYLYMGPFKVSSSLLDWRPDKDNWLLDLKQLQTSQTILIRYVDGSLMQYLQQKLEKGYNEIIRPVVNYSAGYVFVKLIKTDFQFSCNQDLIVGEVNTVQLGTATDYKVGGDLVGEYTTKLSVQYGDKTLPVVWNETLNDYSFDLDLTNIQSESKIRFKVIVEANDVLNASETDVALESSFETIDTLAKLTELFRIGGTGRLGANLTLTNDLTLTQSVNLIGNDCSIDMANHKISVGSDSTFKAQSVGFSNGVNTIQQEPNSTVELTDCSFTGCTGFGSVIDCQVDLASLDDSDDFNTKLTNCTITNCDMAILSGGNLEVDSCNVIGKISNKNYPYFLYQTDGNATILNSEFSLTDDIVYDYDLEFNTCIFTCGETATINGYSHTELQNNNLSAFFDTQRNTSTIDVKYYYSLIEDTVHLQSSKGFCHSVSGVDFVYKTNITLTRGE